MLDQLPVFAAVVDLFKQLQRLTHALLTFLGLSKAHQHESGISQCSCQPWMIGCQGGARHRKASLDQTLLLFEITATSGNRFQCPQRWNDVR